MNNFIYDIPTRVYFGENQLEHIGKEVAKLGKKVLLTYGGGSIKKIGLYDTIVTNLKAAGLEVFELGGIEPNPRVTSVNDGADLCKREGIEVLLAVGGGSTIDATKFIGAAAFYEGDAWDLVTRKAPITNCLPIVSVLTLSGTGSEMDAGGVISNLETKDKFGMGHPSMQPKVSFLDPTVTYSVSPFQTACGSADMMSHILEVYFNMNEDLFMLDTVMEGLMKTIIKYAPIAVKEPQNYEARANLMWTSSWAINGFIDGGKRQAWSCHPMEHELSAIYDIAHGLGLAILTPRWMQYTLDESTVSKFVQFGVNVFGIDSSLPPMDIAKLSIEKLSKFFFEDLGLDSSFTAIGIDRSNFSHMAKKSCNGKVIKGFKPLGQADVEAIFEMCLS